MANEILYKVKDAQVVFRDSVDFAPTAANDLRTGTPTAAQIDCSSLATAAARQSAKVDLGATRARAYEAICCVNFNVAATTGTLVNFYWAPSPSATAGTANPGGASGADAAYDGGANLTLAEGLRQLDLIGSLICGATTAVQVALLNPFFSPSDRYGSLVVENVGGQAFPASMAEFHVVLTPAVTDEVQ